MVRLRKSITEILQKNRLLIAGFLIVSCFALATRLSLLGLAEYPGHGDYAFYYTVAENIIDGKGLKTDYIWTYLSNPETITHTSFDFWMPLTSIIISLSLSLFGKSLHAALIPSIVAGLALSIVAYFLAKNLTESRFVAFCSASLVLFMSHLFSRSILTDSPILLLVICKFCVALYSKGPRAPKDDVDTIYEVAQKFGANYLVLPALRRALEDLYTGEETNDRFMLISEVPDSDMKLYEIMPDPQPWKLTADER